MERRTFNIVHWLHQRQLGHVELDVRQRLASSLSTRKVLLTDILDCGGQLLDGHVVLGFSRCGQLLLSYSCELDVTATHSTYTLHWWTFLLYSPLQHVYSDRLFRGEAVPTELHLLVCQTPSPVHTVVVGCKRTYTEDYRRPCYVTVLPSSPPCFPHHSASSQRYSLHFKFDLMPPFPSFIPSLSLKIPGWVVLNTGDSVVALQYSSPPLSPSPPTPPPSLYSSHLAQVFGYDLTDSPTVCSPSHLLPIDVYCNDQLLADVSQSSKKESGGVAVQQISLDVEVWVNASLHSELANRGMAYHSLIDYDLQLAEVCATSGNVVLILFVLLEASTPNPAASLGSYAVDVIASWNIYTGIAHSLHTSQLKPAQPPSHLSGPKQWNPAAPLARSYHRRSQLPLAPHTTIRAFSNHTVFSGKSLRSLPHPYLPISLTLTPTAAAHSQH